MRPYILITNDDGINAPGILVLTRLMMQIGDVIVVAPDGARSAQSSALTINVPIRYKEVEKKEGLARYFCTGTPTDCVKLAFDALIDRKPDLVVSGINHGSNAAINAIYSGTMGAAFEGCVHRTASIGFSLCDHTHEADFTEFEPFILKIANETLKNGLPQNICLNVNAPMGEIKGMRVARQCHGQWMNEFAMKTDPQGKEYFWLTGSYQNFEPEATDTDEWALAQGYVSIVPSTIDLTAFQFIQEVKNWNLEEIVPVSSLLND